MLFLSPDFSYSVRTHETTVCHILATTDPCEPIRACGAFRPRISVYLVTVRFVRTEGRRDRARARIRAGFPRVIAGNLRGSPHWITAYSEVWQHTPRETSRGSNDFCPERTELQTDVQLPISSFRHPTPFFQLCAIWTLVWSRGKRDHRITQTPSSAMMLRNERPHSWNAIIPDFIRGGGGPAGGDCIGQKRRPLRKCARRPVTRTRNFIRTIGLETWLALTAYIASEKNATISPQRLSMTL